MVKGIKVEEIMQGLPVEERQGFAKRLRAEGGVEVTLTVAGKGRKRKHRWASAVGKVIAIRLSDTVYGKVAARAVGRGLSVSEYCRLILVREVARSHHKKKVELDN